MATRWYFSDSEAAAVSPTISSTDWEHIATQRFRLLKSPDDSPVASTGVSPDSADDLTDRDTHFRQYVSDPLLAQTISGNVKGQFQCSETFNNDNLFLAMKMYVVSNDGTSVTGTLLAITRDTTNECVTTLTNRNFPSTALSSVAANAGDRLVVELGLGGNITSGTGGIIGHNGTMRWGGLASSGDLPENDSETGLTFRPWLEISTDLSFAPPPILLAPVSGAA